MLKNPLPSMPKYVPGTNLTYVRAFPNMTILPYSPEFSFFVNMAGLPAWTITMPEVYIAMTLDNLLNQGMVARILLGTNDGKNIFSIEQMKRYYKFVIIEGGMGGLFQFRTPREYIEGFYDPTISLMA